MKILFLSKFLGWTVITVYIIYTWTFVLIFVCDHILIVMLSGLHQLKPNNLQGNLSLNLLFYVQGADCFRSAIQEYLALFSFNTAHTESVCTIQHRDLTLLPIYKEISPNSQTRLMITQIDKHLRNAGVHNSWSVVINKDKDKDVNKEILVKNVNV